MSTRSFLSVPVALAALLSTSVLFAQEDFRLDLFKLADQLNAQGVQEHHLAILGTFPSVDGYDELQDLCDVVILATAMDSRSRPADASVETVHRFRIDEVISGSVRTRGTDNNHPQTPRGRRRYSVPGAPGFKLPSHDEVLIWRRGGMVRINGVTFKQQPTYPPFKKEHQYILFLKRSRSDAKGYYASQQFNLLFPVAGPFGCVEVEEGGGGRIKSFMAPLNERLEARFFSDKDELIGHLRQRARASNQN